MTRSYTEADFQDLSWHDCHVWRIELDTGVAPATLAFHGVTDLRIDIDWGRSGFQRGLHEVSIDRIERAPILDQKIHLDRPYYRWTIRLNWPASGEIAFGAVGFTLTLRADPVVIGEQFLSRRERERLTGSA